MRQALHTLDISISRIEPGEVDLAMPYSEALTQPNGVIHSGIMTRASTTHRRRRRAERFSFRARVIKPGRTQTFVKAQAFAWRDGGEFLVATMTATLMALPLAA
jgi:acyl-coenzyme A thioesterase PaaI-like protein